MTLIAISTADLAFKENRQDVKRLLEIHASEAGDTPGRKWHLEVLNKSAIVLICAFWEAYCEDLAAEALRHVVAHAPSHDDLPIELRKLVARELKQRNHDLAVWEVAGDGWRDLLTRRLSELQEERNRSLNTPKTAPIDRMFQTAIGIERISDSWRWHKTTPKQTAEKLDKYVTLRGDIAHRGKSARSVQKKDVEDFLQHVERLVEKTGERVNKLAHEATGRTLFDKRV